MAYWFEKKQDIKFRIVDDDGDGDSDFLGETEATMGQIMGARAQTFEAPLGSGRKSHSAKLIVRSEAIKSSV